MYANSFFAQVECNGGSVPFIGIIRTTLIASTTLVLTHFGAKLVGATEHNDCNYFAFALTLPSSEIWNRVYLLRANSLSGANCAFGYRSMQKLHREIYFYILQLLTFSCYCL